MAFRKSTIYALLIIFLWTGCKDDPAGPEAIPPELMISDSFSAISEEEFSKLINVNDPQDLSVDLRVEGLPPWLQLQHELAQLQGTPSAKDIGTNTLVITADNGISSVTREVSLRVFNTSSELQLQERIESSSNSITPGLNGISVAVVDENGQLFTAYSGNIGTGSSHPEYQRNSQFRVASVTKPMTAALVLKLADEGLIGLDDMLLDHYTTPLPNADKMTIRQLLSHTGGVFDHLNSSSFWSLPQNNHNKVWSVEELVELAVRNGSQFNPGVSYGYSNTGFCVLGALVEEVTGMNIGEAYEKLLFEPLGLEHILYDDFSGPNNPIPGLAYNNRSYEYHLTAAGAAGAIAASAADVAMLGWKLYGGRHLSQTLTEQMSVNLGAPLGGQNYGLGTRIWTFAGIQHHGHTGNLMNYQNILMYIPEADISIAMHTHDRHSNWFTLVDAVLIYVSNNFSTTMAKRLPVYYYEPIIRE